MKELLEAIEKVRERIKLYRNQLSQNEMLTRYALIDPILRALGWDTEDPEQVVPEFSTEHGRPDYALIQDGEKLAMVEAKSLGTNLERAREEGFRYCWRNGVPYFLVTDGDIWELHDMQVMRGRLIFSVRLSEANPGAAARQLLALWRPAMPEVQPAPESIMPAPETTVTQPPSPPTTEDYERGTGTPQRFFRPLILKALAEMGGQGRANEVLERVFRMAEPYLTPEDRERLRSGEVRWRRKANWERFVMVRDGLLRSDSPHGIWALSEAGWREANALLSRSRDG